VNRVVQKASFRSPEFIGFFAPIPEIRAGPLPTVCGLPKEPLNKNRSVIEKL
jgi:hypothetical protein